MIGKFKKKFKKYSVLADWLKENILNGTLEWCALSIYRTKDSYSGSIMYHLSGTIDREKESKKHDSEIQEKV